MSETHMRCLPQTNPGDILPLPNNPEQGGIYAYKKAQKTHQVTR